MYRYIYSIHSAFTEARAGNASALVRISRGFDGKVCWNNLDYRGIYTYNMLHICISCKQINRSHTHTDREQHPRHQNTRTRQKQHHTPPKEHLPQTLNNARRWNSAFTEARAENDSVLVRFSRRFDGKVHWKDLDYRCVEVYISSTIDRTADWVWRKSGPRT